MRSLEPVDIIIPTYDNLYQLNDCIQSMVMTRTDYPLNIIVVNNGQAKLDLNIPCGKVIEAEENLGWIGGLREGLKHSTAKYVLFANDDIFIPRSSDKWLTNMVREMELYSGIGAIGPASNIVMGIQNIWKILPSNIYNTTFLIGFCMLVRREALDKAGGVQDMEYGGDDLDLSIRLRKAGYTLLVKRDIFVYHHGFQTGNRLFGGPDKANGWNSREMTDNVNMELIRKHGFLMWRETLLNELHLVSTESNDDSEKEVVRNFLNGEKIIVEAGCGARKTVEHAIGIDIVPKGEISPFIKQVSVADIVADVEKDLPFDDKSIDCIIARHVLEHVIDPIATLKLWKEKLREKGKLILSCPDERLFDTVPLNPEHKHAFTPDSLFNLAHAIGFKGIGVAEGYNNQSFTICLENA